MSVQHHTSLAHLYLPLLAHPEPEIHTRARATLLATYGQRAVHDLQQMLTDADRQVRRLADSALESLPDPTAFEDRSTLVMYVECLGPMRLHFGNRVVRPQDWIRLDSERVGWQKMQSVFAYLLHCGRRGASYIALGEAIWGRSTSESSVARKLSALRQVLAQIADQAFVDQLLVVTRDHCLLDLDTCRSDVQVFEAACSLAAHVERTTGLDAAVPLYEQAIKLYGGPYMADVLPGSGWYLDRRSRLVNEYIRVIERLAEYRYMHDDDRRCIVLCQQALDADPCASEVIRWLLQAYARRAAYCEVEHAYRRYLRAAAIDPQSDAGRQNVVVQTYQALRQKQ